MPRTHGLVADMFRHPPEYIARGVTVWWQGDHPEWTPDEVLLEVYRQARIWWLRHKNATPSEVCELYHRIVQAHLRGERLIALPRRLGPFRAKPPDRADPPHLRLATALEELGL